MLRRWPPWHLKGHHNPSKCSLNQNQKCFPRSPAPFLDQYQLQSCLWQLHHHLSKQEQTPRGEGVGRMRTATHPPQKYTKDQFSPFHSLECCAFQHTAQEPHSYSSRVHGTWPCEETPWLSSPSALLQMSIRREQLQAQPYQDALGRTSCAARYPFSSPSVLPEEEEVQEAVGSLERKARARLVRRQACS